MIVVTGASGQLGRLTIDALLRRVPSSRVVAAVRSPEKAADLAERGVQIRQADYDRPETLQAAFQGAERLLLISSSEVGRRAGQHRNVIQAAREANVGLLAYTSILHADRSPLALAEEHQATEAMLAEAGLPFVLLRNGWYTENFMAALEPALAHGVMLGSAGQGRIASAARRDYAEAAAVVLTAPDQAGKVHELAGDSAHTLAEVAAGIARQAGRPVAYQDLPEAEYRGVLVQAGLPEGFASVLADADARAAGGALFDDGRELSRLIGRPTTPLSGVVADALRLG